LLHKLALILLLALPPASWAATPPHVVVILVDDMGYGDLKCFNPASKIPTPHLDTLAAEGMRFTDAHAPGPLCHMSRYGLMTGRYPFRTDVNRWRKNPLIGKGQVTLASLLRDAGYATAMVGKWHLGFEENGYENPLPGGPVDVGFDSFFGIRASTDIPPYFYIRDDRAVLPPTGTIAANKSEGWSPIQGAFWREGGISPDLKLEEVLPRFSDEAIRVVKDHDPGKPLFLYLAYPAPHTPWLPSEEFEGVGGAGIYGEFTAMVDAEIGRVLGALDKAGMKKDTMVVFTSDNGPVWHEDDVERFGHDSSGGLRGMKADAWEAGHRMPFLVRWPGTVAEGSRSDQCICFTDLLATCADILGRDLPPEAGPDSESFLEVLTGKWPNEQPVRGPIVMKSGSGAFMIRDGDWKLIDRLGSGGFSKPSRIPPAADGPRGQLYNLAADPDESDNLWTRHPEIVQRLSRKMREIRDAGPR
jgi:arylsulfatase A-like enzyme